MVTLSIIKPYLILLSILLSLHLFLIFSSNIYIRFIINTSVIGAFVNLLLDKRVSMLIKVYSVLVAFWFQLSFTYIYFIESLIYNSETNLNTATPNISPTLIVLLYVTFISNWVFLGLFIFYLGRFFPSFISFSQHITGKGIDKSNPHSLANPYRLLFIPAIIFERQFVINVALPKFMRKHQNIWDKIHSTDNQTIYLGERVYDASDLPPNIDIIFDVTNEDEEYPDVMLKCKEYYCEPIWDQQHSVDHEAYIEKIKTVASKKGNIYVHCQMGRGRSANTVMLMLIANGTAANIEEAHKIVSAIRPAIGSLSGERKEKLEIFAKHLITSN